MSTIREHRNEGNVVNLDAVRWERELDVEYVDILARIMRGSERGSELFEACWSEYLAVRRLSA